MKNITNLFSVTITSFAIIFGFLTGPSFAQELNESLTNIENATTISKDLDGENYSLDNKMQEMKQTSMLSESENKQYNKTGNDNIQRDSLTILLEGTTLPEEGYMHLYDSSPYKITNGHVALKVPCDDNSTSSIQVLIGSPPNLMASNLEIVQNIIDPNMTSTFDDLTLSIPGEQCLYHVDLIPNENITTITDIVLNNTQDEDLEFPPTASVVIGINEIVKDSETHISNSTNISDV